MSKIRVGIIGSGNISNYHMKGYEALDNVEVVAACDLNAERVRAFAEKYGVAHTYTDLHEMVQKEELDAVSVCTWNNAHAEATIAALEQGINVLCEKPMAMNTPEANAMFEAAKKSGKLLQIGFVRRFGKNTQIAQEFIDHDELGDIYYIKTKCVRRRGNPGGWFADKSRSGGGPLIDLGVHMIDLSRYLMGKPKAVSVYGATFDGIGPGNNIKGIDRYCASDLSDVCTVEDFATAMIRFDNDAILQVEVSFSANVKKQGSLTLDILGTKGGMSFEPELEIFSEKYDYLTNLTPVYQKDAVEFEANFISEIAHFVDCVANGTPTICPAEDGVELMRILDAVYLSAQTKKEVVL